MSGGGLRAVLRAVVLTPFSRPLQRASFTFDDYIRSVVTPETCPVPEEPLNCKDP